MRSMSAPAIRHEVRPSTSLSFSQQENSETSTPRTKKKRPMSSTGSQGAKGGLFSFGCATLEDTMNRFQTTGRMNERMRQRRRTESEIYWYERRSELLASQVPRRVSGQEMDSMLMRVTRPTASSRARAASASRTKSRDSITSSGGNVVRSEYFALDPDRFKGVQPLPSKEVKQIVRRLSSYNVNTGPAEARRVMSPELKTQVGPLGSYRWKGLKNC